jgi:sigma-B regulation protein RsbU (phosphoserine phosphatase)
LGALRFSFREARLFDDDERRFVLALAAQTAQALDRAQLQRARIDVSRRLQRSLLPPTLPDVPGLEVAVIYHPFGDGIDVGGDFYDVWPIRSGQWAIAIGDAAGTGPEAAALTALVRHTLRALTIMGTEPKEVMRILNTALLEADSGGNGERFCTAIFGLVTVEERIEVWMASGGHPPPIIRRADGRTAIVGIEGGSLLGVFTEPDFKSARVHLNAGDTLVLVTDGVLEARRDGDFFDVDGVERALVAGAGSARAAAIALETAVLQHVGGSLGDDVAAIVLYVPDDL